MGIGRPTTTTEAKAFIGMVQYYRYMCPKRSHILAPLTEAANSPNVENTLEWITGRLL